MSVRGSRFSLVAIVSDGGDLLDLEILVCRVVSLALDVGFPGVRGSQDGVVWPLEFGQVPAQALVAAYHTAPAWPDYD